jgi:DNA-directed RNA polymerase specialized sigma24 family protein
MFIVTCTTCPFKIGGFCIMKQLAQDWAVPGGDNTPADKKQYCGEVTQARVGDDLARDALIIRCLPSVRAIARHLSFAYHFDGDELFSVGSYTLVEKCDQALATDHPCNYLCCCAKWAMIEYMKRNRSPLPAAPLVLSLDRPLISNDPNSGTLADLIADPSGDPAEAGQDYTLLYQAIKRLRPGQREVILRRYGFMGRDPQDLRTIARELYGGSSQIGTAAHRHSWGIAALRKQLASVYAERGQAGRPHA